MLPFFLIFLIAGTGLRLMGRKLERAARQAALWPTVQGELLRCEVVELPGIRIEDVSSWQLQVRYAYVVNGRRFECTQYAFGYGDGRDDAKHRVIADALKRSPQLPVHYNPLRPSEAVLSTAVQTNISTIGTATLVMAAVSALIGFFAGW